MLPAAILLLTAGCEIDYLSHLAAGQLERMNSLIPIEQAIADPKLSQQERDKLTVVKQVRQFGIDEIGLTPGEAYTLFEPSGDTTSPREIEPAAWVLTAAEPDRLVAYRWSYPIVGEIQQKGFFDESMGRREADALAAAGYDVYYPPVDGFSTLGFFPDPIRQSNLRLDEIELAEFLLHEMTHSTVFRSSDDDFNEAMATFVGRAAAQGWFDSMGGADSETAAAARMRYADKGIIDEYVSALFGDVDAYYTDAAARGLDREAIIAGRADVFAAAAARFEAEFSPQLGDPQRWAFVGELPLDNARILAGIRYQGGLDDFSAVLDETGGSFPEALEVYAEAAGAADGRAFLRQWAADR